MRALILFCYWWFCCGENKLWEMYVHHPHFPKFVCSEWETKRKMCLIYRVVGFPLSYYDENCILVCFVDLTTIKLFRFFLDINSCDSSEVYQKVEDWATTSYKCVSEVRWTKQKFNCHFLNEFKKKKTLVSQVEACCCFAVSMHSLALK